MTFHGENFDCRSVGCRLSTRDSIGIPPAVLLRIRDLLSKNPKQRLDLKDHPDGGVYVKDLTVMIVKGARDLQQVMEVQRGGCDFFDI